MIRIVALVLLSLGTAPRQAGAQIISVDSARLLLDIALVEEGQAIEQQLVALRSAVDTLQKGYDSLRIMANQLALAHNYQVREVQRSTEQLVPQHQELQSMMRTAQRQAYWMDHYIRSADFVRYRSYYFKPEDKWANRIFWGGNAAIVGRIIVDFVRDSRR